MAKKKKQEEIRVNEEKVVQEPIGKLVSDAFLDFGNYINNQRHTVGLDGCKPSYRRLIYAGLQFPKGKMVPSTNFISSVANYHPHSLTGIELLNANLVHSGVFTGEGSWGYTEINGTYNQYAAPRYTKERVSDLYLSIFGDLWKEVPMVESPVGPMEISYLPLPLPLCLFIKTAVTGLGVGMKSDYPNFSPVSLYKAYKENNPYLLEPNANLKLDKDRSELERLWKTGKGKVYYSFNVTRVTDSLGNPGVLIEGDTFLFTPKLSKLEELARDGKIYMEEVTDINGPKMLITKVPGARGITPEDIEDLAIKASVGVINCTLNITTGSTAFRVPLYDWIDKNYRNYISLITEFNKKKISKTELDIKVLESIPVIADYVMNGNPKATDEEIMKATGIPLEIVEIVMSKPISYLRKTKDNQDRIKDLKSKLKELKKFDPILFTEDIIKKL